MGRKKVVLAYSGGLDTSVAIPWLKENYDCDVVAMLADVGQGEDLQKAANKARAIGASKTYVEDLRSEFVRDYVFPAIRAGARYEGTYLLGTSLARPIIAKRQVEIAIDEKAEAVAHGCTGKGNDQVRFELTYQALAPELEVIAPWRIWNIRSREDALAYAAAHGIPVEQSKENIYSRDQNLMHLSHEGGVLEDPWTPPPANLYQLTASPDEAPDEPQLVSIGFKRGTPVSVDDRAAEPVALLENLNALGGKHGVGRLDIVENRLVGMKSRGVYETPGGTILHEAHRALESITLDRQTSHFKTIIANRYADLVYDGQWFSPLREALDAFVESTQETVTGEVLVQLYKGTVQAVGRRSPFSLYSEQFATFGEDDVYQQADAEGFIRILGLPQRIRYLTHKARLATLSPVLAKWQEKNQLEGVGSGVR
ncbi:MAG TPA: argininosuccinate synthase [Vicinamibacteria bacterium]|nr:argininosuccinate synthase [Vicinamibacteria bacterium]